MDQHGILVCPKCQQKLRVPSDHGLLSVRCPVCENRFHWNPAEGIVTADFKPIKKKPFFKSISALVALVLVIGLLVYISQRETRPPQRETISSVPRRQSKWITISYADLLDPNTIIRTGQNLKSALLDPHLNGAVQPFVDQYSFLLQHSLEMLLGPDKLPHSSVIDAYQIGSAQPAWVAIFRGGRIHVAADHKNHARVFLLGNDPEKLYHENYPVIRHCLNALTSSDGSPLNVDVFAYRNDYASSELRLDLNPYSVSAASFPPQGLPLDLAGLAAFFNETPELQGAQLERSKGLILYGKQGTKQTLAGANLSLSDFAVAYRAAFHAGDNEAFISLDPHSDPTKVTVNFGGFLEDTRIGSVVLEADKRFKTITSGLDPNTLADIRKYARRSVPSFVSVAEQDLLDSSSLAHGKWQGTRFWFYPDSIGVESDLSYQYALITNPQFTADAERSKDDFASPEEFENKKSATLSPSIRNNIDHMNQNYFQYANAFGELKELTTVARLMGICSWLYKVNPGWLDLDALLSVQLPPLVTPREKAQLVSACVISHIKSDSIDADYVIKNATVVYLTPVLDKKVSEHFENPTNFAKFLCIRNHVNEENFKSFESEALQTFNSNLNHNVRGIIKTKEDLEALALYSAHAGTLNVQEPSGAMALGDSINADKATLEKLSAEIEENKRMIVSATSASIHNDLVDQHNALVSQYESIRERYNLAVGRYNALGIEYPLAVEISGGIDLEPRNFKIKTSQTSAKLQEFRGIMDKVGTEWRSINGAGKWIRNAVVAGEESKNKLPKFEWKVDKEAISGGSDYRHLQADSNHQCWSAESPNGSWRDCRKMNVDGYQERAYDAKSKELQIAEFRSGKLENTIVGQIDNSGRIVFRKSERNDIMKPQEPPVWFSGNYTQRHK